MGEVYRARDTKLGREVALKILPADLATDPERLARFEREARTLAALNHPHIAQVYGFEERAATADAPALSALVMELVPGESLAVRLARGPLVLREVLDLARQIAEGLEAAHEKGIVHRDLKPANVQVTPDGQAKILDFGLAKPVTTGSEGRGFSPGRDADDAATITSPAQLTQHGLVLGTAAYMSPEQARGLPVDARTDVWAFGALLYEMLAGARPFPGPTMTDTLAQILERDPDWTKLPAATPGTVHALIQRCLRKDPKQRLHDIADARFVIEDALAALSGGASGAVVGASGAGAIAAPPPARAVWRHPLPLGLALLTLALGAALIWSLGRTPSAPPREPTYLSLMLPPDQEMVLGGLEISPDGQDLVYSAVAEEGPPGPEGDTIRLFHRRLSEPTARPLPGTENPWNLAFSPDGAWLAFTSKLDLKLKKIALNGGGTVDLADVPWLAAAPTADKSTWTSTGHILLGDEVGPVRRYPAAGGEGDVVVPRSALEGREQGTAAPVALPGDAGILFAPMPTQQVAVWARGQRRNLPLKGATRPRVFGPHLLFWRTAGQEQNDLSVVRLDPDRGEVNGDPVSLLSEGRGTAPFTISDTGTLAYRATRTLAAPARLSWHVRGDASPPPLRLDPPPFTAVARLSPDGRRLLLHGGDALGSRLMVVDLQTGTSQVVVTGSAFWAVWLPDGRRVIYQVPPATDGGAGLFEKPVDGSAPARRLTTSKVWQQPQMVTSDGRFLVYQEAGGLGTRLSETEDNYDLWLLPLEPRGEPQPLLKTQANERLAHVSPDGRWMAYVSDQSGRDEIWVRAFPDGAADIQVSQGGGTEPVWAPDGGTLYYRNRTGSHIYVVPVTYGTVPQFGTASVTVGFWEAGRKFGRMYDIHPSGQALLMVAPFTLGREIKLVLNFDEVIRRKLAEGTK
jgi:Tol biopolymer transport system component